MPTRQTSIVYLDLKAFKRLYFIGIHGSGMEPLARLGAGLGYTVVGSDWRSEPNQDKKPYGVVAQDGRGPQAGDLVIYSTAIKPANPDLHAAEALGLTQCHRFHLLMALFQSHPQIAVSGTHGKTTTTSMTAEVLDRCGLSPGYFAGGHSVYFGGGARPPAPNSLCVYEADESDGSFLASQARIRIVTNIDVDHLDHHGSYDGLQNAFVQFAQTDVLICCADDNGVKHLLPRLSTAAQLVLTYGQDPQADFVLKPAADSGYRLSWNEATVQKIQLAKKETSVQPGEVMLTLPYRGRHYYLNGAAAFVAAVLLNLPPSQIASSLNDYHGVERRLQPLGTLEISGQAMAVYDDYGHHPTEIAAVLGDLTTGGRRVAVLFQPHRYTRTAELKKELAAELSKAHCLFILPVYSAGETPDQGQDHRALVAEFPEGREPHVIEENDVGVGWEIIEEKLTTHLKADSETLNQHSPGWCFLSLGAGDVHRWPKSKLSAQEMAG